MTGENNELEKTEIAVVQRELGEMYAAPQDPQYWSALQLRILLRIAESDPGLWWVFLGRWARAGVVAAVLALMIAGVASVALQKNEKQIAYQSVIDDRVPLTTLERISRTTGISDKEAALRYMLPY